MIARALAIALAWLCLALPVRAQERFENNDYAIDLFSGPVLGSGRIVGLAGAYSAIATGIDGSIFNPAGYAERAEKEIRFWEWDVTAGIWFGGLFRRNDVDNNGKLGVTSADAIQLSGGARMQFGRFGLGATGVTRLYSIHNGAGEIFADVELTTLRAGSGVAWLEGGLVTGVAVSRTAFNLTQSNRRDGLVNFVGYGIEVGALIRPKHERYRIGVAARSPVKSRPAQGDAMVGADGVRREGDFVLPAFVHVPWEVDVGFAYQFGERRSNVPWRNSRSLRREIAQKLSHGSYQPPDAYGGAPYPSLKDHDHEERVEIALENEQEAERRFRRVQPRRYVLIAADLLIYGSTPKGQSVGAFLVQTPERSGAKNSYGVRVGVESEIWQNRMKLRAGSYLEPSRTHRRYYRPHGTFGVDVRLFDIWRWSVRGTATVDGAPRYFNWGLSAGLWW